MMNYQQMLTYVSNVLHKNGGERPANPAQHFRSRSAHCRRVYAWCKRLLEEEPLSGIREDVLLTGAIFHDCGYNTRSIPHEVLGAEIFREFMRSNYPSQTDLTAAVVEMILQHSRKELLSSPETCPELILLMEADLLDEEGALGIVTDCFTIAQNKNYSPDDIKAHLKKNACSILEQSPMVTPFAKGCWEKKQQLVADFFAAFEEDTMSSVELSLP